MSMGSVLDLIRFLKTNPEWLVTLDLRKVVDGVMTYKVPDRSTFYKFAERLGPEKIVEVFAVMVVRLMQAGVIKGEKVSASTPRSSGRGSRTASSPTRQTTTTGGAGTTEGGTETRHGRGTTTARSSSSGTGSTSRSTRSRAFPSCSPSRGRGTGTGGRCRGS